MSKYTEYMDIQERNVRTEAADIKRLAAERIHRRKRRIAGVTTAAVVMCTATVTAAAANRDIFSIAARWLGISADETAENMASIRRTAVNTDTFENLEIVPRDVFSDGSTDILFIDITRTDGGIFDCAPYGETFTDGTPHINTETGEQYTLTPKFYFDYLSPVADYLEENGDISEFYPLPCRGYITEDSDPLDSTVTMAVYMDGSNIRRDRETCLSLYLGDLVSTKHTLRQGVGKSIWIESDEVERINGIWQGCIYFTPTECEKLTLNPDSPSVFKANPQDLDENGDMPNIDVTFTVDEISISAMTASFKIHTDRPEEMLFLNTYSAGEIYLKDGSSIVINSDYTVPSVCREGGNLPGIGEDEFWTCSFSAMLTKNVDINNITAVKLGSEVYSID